MYTLFALLTVTLASVAAVPTNPQRIVGGSVTTIGQYPTIAALLFNSRQACGGTILNNRSVLTAAHCPFGDQARSWTIRVGSTWASSGGTVHTLNTYILHPNFNRWNLDNDIAIMRTANNINFINNAVRPGSIAGSNYNIGDNQVVWAAGWGFIRPGGPSSEQLRHVQVWIINLGTCRSRYSAIGRTVTDNMLCSGWLDVGGRDQCQGDSGGPLYHNGVVVGVCSWGESCALPRFPGVNVRVPRYTSWIQSNS